MAFNIMASTVKFFLLLISILQLPGILSAQRVLVIGIDGVRADAAEVANTPFLDALRDNGIYSPDALNDDNTISGPGWSAILCGVWSEKHLVTGNNFSNNNYQEYPSFFQRVEAHDSSLNTVSICHWSPINNSIVVDDADITTNVTSDLAVELEAVNHLKNEDPHVMFLHFDEIDGAGHSFGFASDVTEYRSAIEAVDVHVGNVIKALELRPNFVAEDWAILITSDHGGHNFSHGGTTIQEENVFFYVSGNSIAHTIIQKDSTFTIDNANNCLGDSTELSFDGSNDYVQIPNISQYNFGSNQDFTIECRVRTDQAGDVSIVGNKDWDSGLNRGFVFSFKFPSGPEWKVNIGDGSNRADINTGGSIADGMWHTLSVSFDRDGQMRMYEDGVFVDQISIAGIGNIDNGADLFFGTDIDQDYDYIGSISEVRIWDKVISDQEILDHHCDSITSNHPSFGNLIGYWKANEGTGSSVEDHSNNDNDGTIHNATWYEPDTVWTYDYSNTPRLVDIPVTAMAHLCIPIAPDWNLDGKSWKADCFYDDALCANPGFNTWIGPSTGLWTDDSNWSKALSPIPCDHVIIPTGNVVQILNGDMEKCQSVKLEGNAELKIEEGGQLLVREEE